jgi:hypothetical protein
MLIYSGSGEHKVGIPARDLSDEEVEQNGGEELLIATGLYIKPVKSKKAAVGQKNQPPEVAGVDKEK